MRNKIGKVWTTNIKRTITIEKSKDNLKMKDKKKKTKIKLISVSKKTSDNLMIKMMKLTRKQICIMINKSKINKINKNMVKINDIAKDNNIKKITKLAIITKTKTKNYYGNKPNYNKNYYGGEGG